MTNDANRVLLIFEEIDFRYVTTRKFGVLLENERLANKYIKALASKSQRMEKKNNDTVLLEWNPDYGTPDLAITKRIVDSNTKYRLSIQIDYHEENRYESYDIDYLCNMVQEEIRQLGYEQSIRTDVVAKWLLINKQYQRIGYVIQIVDKSTDSILDYVNPLADIDNFFELSMDDLQWARDLYFERISNDKVSQEIDDLCFTIKDNTDINKQVINDEIMQLEEPIDRLDLLIRHADRLRELHKDAEVTFCVPELQSFADSAAEEPIPHNTQPAVANFIRTFYDLAHTWIDMELASIQESFRSAGVELAIAQSNKQSCDEALVEFHYDCVMLLTKLLPHYYNMQLAATRDSLQELLDKIKNSKKAEQEPQNDQQ